MGLGSYINGCLADIDIYIRMNKRHIKDHYIVHASKNVDSKD